jgi:putative colanic acid biosynthesis UDP-glucose lipid carrier transferase
MAPVPGKCLKDTAELSGLVKSGTIDQVFVTLPLEQAGKLAEIQQWLDDEPITLHFIPDLGDLAKLRGRMEEFDGLPIISLQSSPLQGWNSSQTNRICQRRLALLLFTKCWIAVTS